MKRILAIAICLVFLASGLVRIAVGALMIGQAAGWWALGGEFATALPETQQFIVEREVNLVGFTSISYFAYIMFMGLTISLGAIGQLLRKPVYKRAGLVLIGIYLLSHLALFANFATINPKIFLWAASVVAALVLVWTNRAPQPENRPPPAS